MLSLRALLPFLTKQTLLKVNHHPFKLNRIGYSKYLPLCNFLSKLNLKMEQPREIQIPHNYGYIAAKEWGPSDGQPVLALHGWLDNAGTFDRLVPLLNPDLRIICIDMPGHGLSSHKPPGMTYNFMEGLVDIKKVLNYLNWNDVILLGHSMGCALSLLFAATFPDNIKAVIGLDLAKPIVSSAKNIPKKIRFGIEEIIQREEKLSKPPPVYTQEEARSRLLKGLNYTVIDDVVEILLKRGTKPSEDGKGLIFSRDLRLRDLWGLSTLSEEDARHYANTLTCNLLLVMATESIFTQTLEEVKPIYKKYCKRFESVIVEGTHFVHLNNPERVAPEINKFLSELKNTITLSKV